jgi:hypothetical protein
MIKRIVGILICLVIAAPAFSVPASAEPGAELEIHIMGGLPLPFFLHLVGGVIGNIGDTAAYNISYQMTITGGLIDGIHKSYEGFAEEIQPGNGISVLANNVFGFGPVDIVITASASNAENVTNIGKGFQFREFTWVPFSWINAIKK